MFAGFTQRLNFGMGGGTVSVPSAFPTRPIGQLGNFNTYAINFIAVTGITASDQQSAINQLSYDLVNTGLMNKMIAVYPFVGGNATTHQYNLKDPRNADTAFRLTFSGGWTHSSTGILPNATNTFANTYINTLANIPQERHHVSYYSRTATVLSLRTEVGSNNGFTFFQFSAALTLGFYSAGSSVAAAFTTTSTGLGFWVGNKVSFADRRAYRNGVREGQNTNSVTTFLSDFPLYIGARNNSNGAATQFSNKECAFCSIGYDLTDAEVATLYTIVQNFQTTLGRQV
jgi:hypothetical protein